MALARPWPSAPEIDHGVKSHGLMKWGHLCAETLIMLEISESLRPFHHPP